MLENYFESHEKSVDEALVLKQISLEIAVFFHLRYLEVVYKQLSTSLLDEITLLSMYLLKDTLGGEGIKEYRGVGRYHHH